MQSGGSIACALPKPKRFPFSEFSGLIKSFAYLTFSLCCLATSPRCHLILVHLPTREFPREKPISNLAFPGIAHRTWQSAEHTAGTQDVFSNWSCLKLLRRQFKSILPLGNRVWPRSSWETHDGVGLKDNCRLIFRFPFYRSLFQTNLQSQDKTKPVQQMPVRFLQNPDWLGTTRNHSYHTRWDVIKTGRKKKWKSAFRTMRTFSNQPCSPLCSSYNWVYLWVKR